MGRPGWRCRPLRVTAGVETSIGPRRSPVSFRQRDVQWPGMPTGTSSDSPWAERRLHDYNTLEQPLRARRVQRVVVTSFPGLRPRPPLLSLPCSCALRRQHRSASHSLSANSRSDPRPMYHGPAALSGPPSSANPSADTVQTSHPEPLSWGARVWVGLLEPHARRWAIKRPTPLQQEVLGLIKTAPNIAQTSHPSTKPEEKRPLIA